MSLVVLRSWGEGQPPKVKAIAPPDSDKDEVVIPDNKGRFVTTEVDKKVKVQGGQVNGFTKPVPQPRSSIPPPLLSVAISPVSSSSPSPPVPDLRPSSQSGHHWAHFGGGHHAPLDKARTLPHDFRKIEALQLSRESSVNSGATDSPPSSPVCGSRYKSLGPELAATIPRRQIIRETWVKESEGNFMKQKELSKSTPDLLSHDILVKEDPPLTHQLRPVPRRNRPTAVAPLPPRPLSYIDIFYGSDGEPQFGDRPASVVQVFKKEPLGNSQNRSQSEQNLVDGVGSRSGKLLELEREGPKTAENVPKVIRKYKAGRSFSSELRRDPVSNNRFVIARKDSLPTLPSSSAQVFRSELRVLPLISSGSSEFPVHKVVHSTSEASEEESVPVRPEFEFKRINSDIPVQESKPEGDENEEIDSELEALRDESSRSTASTIEVETIPADSPEGIVPNRSESDMSSSTTCSSSAASSPQFFFKDTRRSNNSNFVNYPNGKQAGKVNGSAWAQVPVQCINRHVFLPEQEEHFNPTSPAPPAPPPEQTRNNGQMGYGHVEHTNYRANQQRRKNFCDELLNDVIIQVPPSVRSRMGPPTGPPPPQPPPPNHDGIIIFDEEEEDELNLNMASDVTGSDTGSISNSEREKSVDYISVFHNVQVGSINSDYSSPTTMKNFQRSATIPAIGRIVGIDLGSHTTRYATLEKESGEFRIGPVRRSLTSADGLRHGAEAIPHALQTKSKLIYKWKRKQSFPYDPYDSEDCGTTLETLLRSYRQLLVPPKQGKESQEPHTTSSGITQWNLSIHSGMDKKLIREAAFDSGLLKSTDDLRLVNESTAAAITAYGFLQRQIPAHTWGKTFLSVNIGSTFIHTSGYELRGKKLHSIESSDSQLYESPESSFIELFSRIFGREFILKFESAFQPSWIEILTRFDEMKELFCKTQCECYLFLPISFYLEYNRFTGMQIPECLEDNIEEGIRWDRNGAIQFNKDLMSDWLQPAVTFVKTRFKIKSYDSIVLSGGGTNQYIASELKRLLPLVNVYNLPDPETAVVEGLVRLDSAQVTVTSPFSIGVGVMTPFDETCHPQEKAVTRQGKKWCSDVWDTLICKGQTLTLGQAVLKRSYVGAQPGQNILVLPIFKSELEDPKLVTSPTVQKCCELRFEITKDKTWREVQLVIRCYESELSIIATGSDEETNRVVIDF